MIVLGFFCLVMLVLAGLVNVKMAIQKGGPNVISLALNGLLIWYVTWTLLELR